MTPSERARQIRENRERVLALQVYRQPEPPVRAVEPEAPAQGQAVSFSLALVDGE